MVTNLNTYRILESHFKTLKDLNEGLIMTHDIYDSWNILQKTSGTLDFGIFQDSDIIKNKIFLNIGNMKFINFTRLITLINNLGYYISTVKVYLKHKDNGNIMSQIYKWEEFTTDYFTENLINNVFIQYNLELEPKFDITVRTKSNILYHVTEERYLDKILKNGLISKSHNTIKSHPERIYFTYDINDSLQYVKTKQQHYKRQKEKNKEIEKSYKNKYQETKFILLKIDISNLNDIIFFEDPNLSTGIYTYDNIPSTNITVLKNTL